MNDYSLFEEEKIDLAVIQDQKTINRKGRLSCLHCFPKTLNDCKVLGIHFLIIVMHLLFILTPIFEILYTKNERCVLITIWLWIFTFWFSILGAVSYICKLYKVAFLIIVYISIGVLLPFIWLTFMYFIYKSYLNLSKNTLLVLFTFAAIYTSVYLIFLTLYMITDTSFLITIPIIVLFRIIV